MKISNPISLLLYVLCVLSICSCNRGKLKPAPLSSSLYYDNTEYEDDNVVDVPFKMQGGVRYIQVKINDSSEYPMIFDTGCSGMLISTLEYATLLKHGYVSEEDREGTAQSQIADGSVISTEVVNLKKIRIGDYECHNVQAQISENINAPLLLGNGALKNVRSFSVDDNAHIIKFHLK